MANSPFEPIKVNLVEVFVWEKRFGGDNFFTSDSAWEDYRNMRADDFESLIDDLWSARDTKKRVSKKRLTSEELQFLAEQLNAGNEHLEPIKQAITDALTWMYEAAAQPSDGDIKEAMERAAGVLIESDVLSSYTWEPLLEDDADVRRGPKEWSPRKKYTGEEILKQLMGQVSYEHEKGRYDRYLIFNFWDAKVAQELFSRMKGGPIIYDSMKSEFDYLAKQYTTSVFHNLVVDDVSNRTDWGRAWKSMLKSGVEVSVREGIREVLKEMPDA